MEKEKINSPKIGSIVRHTGWKRDEDINYPCDVYITSGQFLSGSRLSNFWYWKRILHDGSLSAEEHGYGDFEETESEYEVITNVKRIEK